MKRILAVVPARGGSKGITGKNLQPVAGRPLIAWTISAALNARALDRVVVSTDDDDIAEYARAAGAEVPMRRPPELATDRTPGIDPVIHAVRWLDAQQSYRPEHVMILQPTSPLRTSADIDAAVALLESSGSDAVISVVRMLHPMSWTSALSDEGVLIDFRADHEEESDRQSGQPRYAQNGAIFLVSRDRLLRRTLYGERTIGYVMPHDRSLDIDEPADLIAADAALRTRPVPSVAVGGRTIGSASCFVIAEAGVNHNGRPELAERLIDAAAHAGADAVKFQTWNTEALVTRDAPLAEYQRQPGGPATQYELLKALELPAETLGHLKDHAARRGIEFFSTADDEESADTLHRLGVRVFKIGSGELTNLHLLRHVAAMQVPMIVSTGMATLLEVERAVRAIESTGNRGVVLLHCVSAYPSAAEESNLRAMDTLAGFGYPVGFSDHTLGEEAALAAVARGAAVVEKHLTLDRSMAGPDHAASMEPDEFHALVTSIRVIEAALGDGIKRPTPSEIGLRAIVRKVVVAARDLRAGDVLAAADVTLRRASGGLTPIELERLLGRRLRRDIARDTPLTADQLSE